MQESFFRQVLDILQKYWPSMAIGIQNTLIISLTGMIIGLVIGLFVGGLRAIRLDYTASKSALIGKKILDFAGKVYIRCIPGNPDDGSGGIPVLCTAQHRSLG